MSFAIKKDNFKGSPGKAYKTFKKAAKKIGLGWMSIHTLRRMRGTRWVQLVVDPKTVQEMMGHKDMRTAMGYLHWNQQHGADAVRAAQEKENQEYEAAKNVQAIEKVAGEKRETEATPLTSGASSDGSM